MTSHRTSPSGTKQSVLKTLINSVIHIGQGKLDYVAMYIKKVLAVMAKLQKNQATLQKQLRKTSNSKSRAVSEMQNGVGR